MDVELPERKSNRLKSYNYSQSGFYFITICSEDKNHIFGKVVDDKVFITVLGEIANQFFMQIPEHYPEISIDEYVLMPNHLHAILVIDPCRDSAPALSGPDEEPRASNYGLLSKCIQAFKSLTVKESKKKIQWQRSFYDHIISGEESYLKIKEYIRNNPLKWSVDAENDKSINRKDYYNNLIEP